jgi:hypothetical protein
MSHAFRSLPTTKIPTSPRNERPLTAGVSFGRGPSQAQSDLNRKGVRSIPKEKPLPPACAADLRRTNKKHKQKTRPKEIPLYQSPPRSIVKNCQTSAIRKSTMADRPAPITKKILLSSALGGASSVVPTRTAENPIITAKPKMIQKPFGDSLCFIVLASPQPTC